MAQQIYSVSELANSIKLFVEANFENIRLKGEVQGVKVHQSGHVYFALKDDKMLIDAICWKWSYLKQSIKLEDGMEIVCDVSVTTYPLRSKYQVIVKSYELAGEGALLKMLADRKKKLLEAGYFSKKRELPFLPQKIGVITSESGAVFHDILNRLRDRFPMHVMLWPVLVQGEGAATDIANAIAGFNSLADKNRPDVLIIARGGGSMEDLMPFNEELVVKAVFNSNIPTISAVGHETDTTLCDFAADVRAATPTAAAEIVVPLRDTLLKNLENLSNRMRNSINNLLNSAGLKLKQRKFSENILEGFLSVKTQRVDYSFDTLSRIVKNKVNALFTELGFKSKLLESYSYQKTLNRGFSIVFDDNEHVVKTTDSAKIADKMKIIFSDGEIFVKKL